MRGGGWSWAGLGLTVLLAGGPARGQPRDAATEPPPQPADTPAGAGAGALAPTGQPAAAAPLPPSPPSDSQSPEQLMAGPSLRETGRIAVAPVPMSSTGIENEDTPKSPNEKSISHAASTITPAPTRPQGVIDPRVLNREIAERFGEIGSCRVEVARAKQVKPPQIVADKILLRWMIEPDGTTGPTEVVAIAPVDLGIMDCAKRAMSQWRFTPPRGGAIPVERRFSFTTQSAMAE
jgi:hypothetical protein